MFEMGILFVVLGVLWLYAYIKIDDDLYREVILSLAITSLLVGAIVITTYITKEVTAIECLKGNNPYKEQIVYEWQDSIQVPVDTIYSLKK
jgi:hypothetical protein